MHPQSETELEGLAVEFLQKYRDQDVHDIQQMFIEEAMARYSKDDDGDRQTFWNDANQMFAKRFKQSDLGVIA